MNVFHVVLLAVCTTSCVRAFDLTVLHTNDVHARFEEIDSYGGSCSDTESLQGECFGGVARRATKVKEIRSAVQNTLFLDGGDQFQGTNWFYIYKGEATSHFMNLLGYDAMAFGNHEFDNGPDGLRQFLLDVNADVVNCNINATGEPSIDGLFSKSVVLTVASGDRVGVVGYTYSRSPEISDTGKLVFGDEVPALQLEVDRLTAMGINKIIALGHSGFDVDLIIANEVRGVDIVIGGHTNTFLYTGTPPIDDPVAEGPYPTVVHPDYKPAANVLVVQDYTFGMYLGRLDVTFDDAGGVTSWDGNPILLDVEVEQDPQALAEIEDWAEAVRNFSNVNVGISHVLLDGDCRLSECNLGNFIMDAYLWQNIKFLDEIKWNDVAMGFINGGGIRSSLPAGDITVGDVMTVLPFGNTVDIVTIKGEFIKDALENSVIEYNVVVRPGRFLQFGGMIVTYDLTRDPGDRVVKAEVRCTECDVPDYENLDPEKIYKLVMPSFLITGGDGYEVIADNLIERSFGNLDSSVLIDYIQQMTPITPGIDRRIVGVGYESCTDSTVRPTMTISAMSTMILCGSFLKSLFNRGP